VPGEKLFRFWVLITTVQRNYIPPNGVKISTWANFYKLIDDTKLNHEPGFIAGKRGNALHLAEEDWN
jgi:hypothetical protein